VTVLQGDSGGKRQSTEPKVIRNLREFPGVLARGGIRVAKPPTAIETGAPDAATRPARFLRTTTPSLTESRRQRKSDARTRPSSERTARWRSTETPACGRERGPVVGSLHVPRGSGPSDELGVGLSTAPTRRAV
jgi:hypothetical protein